MKALVRHASLLRPHAQPQKVCALFRRTLASSSKTPSEWKTLLENVASGAVSPDEAINIVGSNPSNAQVLESFANLDHNRQKLAGFPEAVFAEGKTARQVAAILDDMAKHADPNSTSAILATR